MKIINFFGFSLRLVIGLVFYAFSKQFRAMIQYKMSQITRGPNEPVASGEEVTAVLGTPEGKRIIH